MEGWKSYVALTVVGVLATGPAWAQTSTPSSSDKSSSGSSATTPGASGSSSGSSMDKSGTSGSSETKGEMKSGEMMKGEMMKGGKGRSARGGGNAEQVKAAQQALKDKGHDPGSIDGRMGPKTKAALKEFQKAEGLKETGQLDSETRAKLGVQMSGMGASSPSASPSTGSSSSTGGSSGGGSTAPSSPSSGGTK